MICTTKLLVDFTALHACLHTATSHARHMIEEAPGYVIEMENIKI